jgi:hypothetical protein
VAVSALRGDVAVPNPWDRGASLDLVRTTTKVIAVTPIGKDVPLPIGDLGRASWPTGVIPRKAPLPHSRKLPFQSDATAQSSAAICSPVPRIHLETPLRRSWGRGKPTGILILAPPCTSWGDQIHRGRQILMCDLAKLCFLLSACQKAALTSKSDW